jgi:hypothetical protein
VIGIFFIRNILMTAADIIPAVSEINKEEFEDFGILNLVVLLLEFLVSFLLTYILLFKTNWVIDKLKLDKNFQQETFNFNIDRAAILRIGIIVLGGLVIVDSIPALVQEIIYFIEMKKSGAPDSKNYNVILQSVKLLIGILLIAYQNFIVNFVEHKRRKSIQ